MMGKLFPYMKKEHWIFSCILVVALLLRVWGIGFGLPYVYHYDEHFYINTALNLGTGVLNNPPYAPTGLSNILFVQYAAYYALGKGMGNFTSPQAFELAYRTDPTVFYLLGRLTSALLGSVAVGAVFVTGKSVFGTKNGLLAAAFMAASFLHVRDSHYAVPDIAMSSFVVLSVALAAMGQRTRKIRYVYASAMVGGFAIATKWTAFPVLLPVLWVGVVSKGQASAKILTRLVAPEILLLGGLSILGFVLGSPQIVLNPRPYLEEALRQYGAGKAGGFEIWQVDTVSGWLFYAKTLAYGVGLAMSALAAIGLVTQLASSPETRTVLLLLFPTVYYVLMGSTRHYFARYTLPLLPFVALFSAEGVLSVSSWLSKRRVSSVLPVTALALLTVAQPLAQSMKSDLLLTREDTRTTAKIWIEANISDGARFAVDWPLHTPPLATSKRCVSSPERAYEVYEASGEGLSVHTPAWYRDQGFDYLIASSFIYRIPLVDHGRNARRYDFYRSLESEFDLVKEFRPANESADLPFIFDEIYGPAISVWQRECPGPVIKIYRVRR
jgi:hypothetical protein